MGGCAGECGCSSNKAAKEGEGMISITKAEYDALAADSRFLAALEGAGVDNWDGYDNAQDMLEEWDKEDG